MDDRTDCLFWIGKSASGAGKICTGTSAVDELNHPEVL